MDDATRHQLAAIDEATEHLPAVVRYLRTRYPQVFSTPDLIVAMSAQGQKESETRKQLKESDRVRPPTAGKAHGTLNTEMWQYKPKGNETPWKPEYVAGSPERQHLE